MDHSRRLGALERDLEGMALGIGTDATGATVYYKGGLMKGLRKQIEALAHAHHPNRNRG